MAAQDSGLELLRQNEVVASAFWDNVHIGNYRAKVGPDDIMVGVEDFEKLARKFPDRPKASFMIAEPNIPLPDSTIRRMAAEGIRRTTSYKPCQAVVLLGDGFWVSAARSVLLAIQMVNPIETNMRVFRTIEEAAEWTVGQLGRPPGDAQPLADAAERVRRWTG